MVITMESLMIIGQIIILGLIVFCSNTENIIRNMAFTIPLGGLYLLLCVIKK